MRTNKNGVVYDGSHFGINVGKMALNARLRGMLGNDAGISAGVPPVCYPWRNRSSGIPQI